MSDTATDLTPPPDDQAPPLEPEQVAAPEPVADEDQLEPELAAQVIDIPEGEKLVPLSALTATRKELKQHKTAAGRAAELEQQIQQLQGQIQQTSPVLQAAQALLQAQQQQQAPPQPQGPTPQQLAELEDYARDLDLYDKDGKPDIARAHRIKARTLADAQQIAQQAVQPVVDRSLSQDAQYMLARAKATKLPNGEAPDPAVLDQVVARIAKQPGGLKMLTQEDYVSQLWYHALGLTRAMQGGTAPAQQAEPQAPPPPIFSEKSGGAGNPSYSLNTGDKRLAKDLGLSESEFAKQAASMPWGKR
jgi:hypothetical protein